jgi:phytoene dehydrogenase-like protein
MTAIVIGGGVNGLVAAAALAKRKMQVVVVERRPSAGGAAITAEVLPGVRIPRLSHTVGPLHRDVTRGLRLDRVPNLEFLTPDPSLTTFGAGGETIAFHPDPVLTAAAIDRVSPKDAGRWREFLRTTSRIARVFADLSRHAPPTIDGASLSEKMWLLRTGRRSRSLGRRDLARAVRWMAMPMTDILDEWFENDLLKAAIAARAVFGHLAGPFSPGTGAIWLQRLADDPAPVGSGSWVRGGPGALADGLVGLIEKAGGQLRTGVSVSRIVIRQGAAAGVVLDNGDEIEARVVVSGVDPRQTFLRLIETDDLTPSFIERIRRYRVRGVTAKINLVLSGPPEFTAASGDPMTLRGRILIAPGLEYLERAFDAAKYGAISPEPWLELRVPSEIDSSLAPEGQHVMSIYVHYAPRHLRDGTWATERDRLYRLAMDILARHAPGLERLVVDGEILTPEDLERDWGLSGGHIFHGEMTMDQAWIARPVLGWAHYRTPIEGLYLAGAGSHPGGGLTGGSGWLAAQAVVRSGRR